MAGYIFSLDQIESLQLYAQRGVYATKLSPPRYSSWNTHHEGTFADYATMRPGDNVYFFIKRKVYGIGTLVRIGDDCKYFNYPKAGLPHEYEHGQLRSQLLWDESVESVNQRCLCLFKPDPYLFTQGIDMDDVLASHPSAFKMLRAFWKLSFIKFDDEENQAFRDVILKRNERALADPVDGENVFEFQPSHEDIANVLSSGNYEIERGFADILRAAANGTVLRHEMAVEAGLLQLLSSADAHTINLFGKWDYLSHQVIASPFKPIDYMDKMDLFGYAYITDHKPTKARFLVGEIKKDSARQEDVDQLLKYVDWVHDEYCYGDYGMINAFLIASDFPDTVVEHMQAVSRRQYTTGMRPAISHSWDNVTAVRYKFDPSDARLYFDRIR